MMIDILIPTYNRSAELNKNIKLLIKEIKNFNLDKIVSLSISDNCSNDQTKTVVEEALKDEKSITFQFYRQEENIGLERNAIFLLEKSQSEYVIYLGDDDFLPEGYLKYLVNKIKSESNLTCVIPGFSGLYSDGQIKPSRTAEFDEKLYHPSFKTVMALSQYGHQLSGILLKRNNLYNSYTKNKRLRNIYPFIYFTAYNNLAGKSIFAPYYQVLVSQSNSKDWNYDASGLLTEIFKNYKILFERSYIKRNIMNFVFMYKQNWRMRIGKDIKPMLDALLYLEKDKDIDMVTKVILPVFYLFVLTRKIVSKTMRVLNK